jgi:cell fate regulator YaaT (PSP1 superfamily)
MEIPETLSTLGTSATGQRETILKKQSKKQSYSERTRKLSGVWFLTCVKIQGQLNCGKGCECLTTETPWYPKKQTIMSHTL